MNASYSDKVFSLADTLQIEMRVYRAGNLAEIRGDRLFKFPVSSKPGANADIKVPVKVVASYIGDRESSVLVHIKKDLYAYLMFFQGAILDDDMLQLRLVDASKVNAVGLKKATDGLPTEMALKLLAPYTKAVFEKQSRAIEWTRLNGQVDIVGQGSGQESKGDAAEPA